MPKQNTSPFEHPQAVLREIEQLAQHIVVARKRRGETQAQWARKLGVSQPTMARIERGDPSVAMASYVMCLWLINPWLGLADLIAPARDQAALEREVSRVRQKVRPRKSAAPGAAPGAAPNSAPTIAAPHAAAPAPVAPGQLHPTAAGLASLLAASGKHPL
jgi:DNA-binding XRE family transcriptional regulator